MARISQKVFIDSSLLLGFIDRANFNHAKSMAIMDFLARQQFQVYTSLLVVMQTQGRLERDLGSVISLEFLQAVLESNIQLLSPTKSEILASYRFLKTNPQRQVSLAEVINANLMQKHDIPSIITFDFWRNLLGTKVSSLINP